MPSSDNPWVLTFITAGLVALSLIAAMTLEILGDDASKAWDAFAGFAVFFGGVHVPSPAQAGSDK
jgi:hypothetical protein